FYPFGLRMAGLSLVPGVKNSYLFTGKEAQDELGLGWIDFGARMYDAAAGRWNGVDALGEKYTAWSPYNYAYNNPVLFTDPDGNSGVVSISVRGDGKIVLTFSSTLHVRGDVSDETIANMNRERNRYLNTQSVEYDENIVIAFQVNAVRENLDEFDPEKDNFVDIVPGANHMRISDWKLERMDTEKDEADVRVWPGNNLRITQQNADGVIDPYQKEGSNTLPHEVLHAFGILDRYAGPQPNPEYEDDMMGQGKRTYLRNREQFQGIVEMAKSAQEKSQTIFYINSASEGVVNYNLSRVSVKQKSGKLPQK
ncbi:MAG: RHS repeat-associated core domain-containing protein, partial [Bacteroidia bacterium]|nr:RHS repeat-associated core domain-containing protein [Bacteroidia bacterium]